MRAALLIALKELRQRLRDRSVYIFGLAAPLALAYVFSLLLGPLVSGTADPAAIGLVDLDRSAASSGMGSLLGAVQDAGAIAYTEPEDESSARAAVRGGDLDAAIVIPNGFGAALGRSETGVMVIGSADSAFGTQLAEALADSFVGRVRAAVWTVAALQERALSGGGIVLAPLVMAQVASADQPVRLVDRPTSARQLDAVTYVVAGMAVFFVFFIVQIGVAGLLDEEQGGTIARLLAAPIPRRAIIGGKVIASVAIGVSSLLVLWGASTLIMGARWGQPLGVALLIVSAVAAAAGVLMAVAGVARTAEAAGNVQSIVAITLGALGGTFFPIPESSGALASLVRISPHYWFLRGLGDLAEAGVRGALPDVAAILAFALVFGALGYALFSRRLAR